MTPQDEYIARHRYADVVANTELFPDSLSYRDYRQRRADMRAVGYDVPDLRGRPTKVNVTPAADPRSPEQIWSAVTTFQKQTTYSKGDVEISVETDRPFGIVFVSDWHIGNKGTDHDRIMADIALINSCPQLGAFVGGDGVDNFVTPKLAHAARDEQVANPDQQWQMYRYAIEQIRPSLLAVGTGNHDAWTHAVAGINGVDAALRDIPIVNTGEDCYIDLTIGTQLYTIFRKHRPPSSSRKHRAAGAKMLYEVGRRTFDVGITEHLHVPSITVEPRHGAMRYFITTGSYKVHDGHATEFGFFDSSIGTPVIIFYPDGRKIVPFMEIEDAIAFLESA